MFTIWDCVVVDLAACQSSLAAHGTLSVFFILTSGGTTPRWTGELREVRVTFDP